ncbi:MAG: tetratricopeptide repeat protein [Planctomycetota bacterium]|nr:MAG: tetratricopeptide repeat protein [Planctomycetota bacterium]
MHPLPSLLAAVLGFPLLGISCGDSPPPAPPTVQGLGQEDRDPRARRMFTTLSGRAEREPQDVEAWLDLGMALEANGYVEKACQVYAYAVRLTGAHAKLWYRLAQASMESDRSEEALSAFRRARAADGKYAPIAWRHGFLLLKLGRLAEAEQEFRRALELETREAPAWVGLARVQLQLGEPAAAIASLETLLEHFPYDSYGKHLLSAAYRDAGRMADVRRQLESGKGSRAFVLPPPWSDSWNNELRRYQIGFKHRLRMAQNALRQRRNDVALPIFEELHAEHEDSVNVTVGLASAYINGQRTADALALLEQARAVRPNEVELLISLAQVCLVTGELERGLFRVEDALQIHPQGQKAQALRTSLQQGLALERRR